MSAAQCQPPSHSRADQSIPNIFMISAGSANNMGDTSLECGRPQNKCEKPNHNYLPCCLGPEGV